MLISVGRDDLLHVRGSAERRRHSVQPILVIVHIVTLRSWRRDVGQHSMVMAVLLDRRRYRCWNVWNARRRSRKTARSMTLQYRVIGHRCKHQALLVVVLAEDFVITQIKFIADAEPARREIKLKIGKAVQGHSRLFPR